jgi:MbtH protein
MSSSPGLDGCQIDGNLFRVLVNAEEQYSLWPAALTPPEGWTATEVSGSKQDCLTYVDAHWLDLRPKSLRDRMSAQSTNK